MFAFLSVVVQVVLAVIAWRRGWKGWALLPFALYIVISLIWGTVGTSNSSPATGAVGPSVYFESPVWADAVVILVLLVMVFRPRRKPVVRQDPGQFAGRENPSGRIADE